MQMTTEHHYVVVHVTNEHPARYGWYFCRSEHRKCTTTLIPYNPLRYKC